MTAFTEQHLQSGIFARNLTRLNVTDLIFVRRSYIETIHNIFTNFDFKILRVIEEMNEMIIQRENKMLLKLT